jgi:hypothetical protein
MLTAYLRSGLSLLNRHQPRLADRMGVSCLALVMMLTLVVPHAYGAVPTSTTVPDFAAQPTIVSVAGGTWSNPATWSPARVPAAGDIVVISAGTAVVYDIASTVSIGTVDIASGGSLSFLPSAATALTVTQLVVEAGGTLTIGTTAAPITGSAELRIADQPIDLTLDPQQFGTGLIGVGTVSICGSVKAPTFVRLASEPNAGDSSLHLSKPAITWNVGDHVVIPDTRQLNDVDAWAKYTAEWEECVIGGISADGLTVTLTAPLAFDHLGAHDATGALRFAPHVANLTRNVLIHSQNPQGTRGHAIFLGRAQVDIRYCEFSDLGRTTLADLDSTTFDANGNVTHIGTNQIGRYAVHMHHLEGPFPANPSGYQYTFIGNSIVHSLKWSLDVHDSHYGLIQSNVVYDGQGAGYSTETGNETGNVWIGNIGIAIVGNVSSGLNDGRDGTIFWLLGFDHFVRDNVAADGIGTFQHIVSGTGYQFVWFNASTANTAIPAFPGADESDPSQVILVNEQTVPIRDFTGNEAYGGISTGLSTWSLGADGYDQASPPATISVVRNFTVWHQFSEAYFPYATAYLIIDGLEDIGDPSVEDPFNTSAGLNASDYWAQDLTIRNSDFCGVTSGLGDLTNENGVFTIENCTFETTGPAIHHDNPSTGGSRSATPARSLVLKNCRFTPWTPAAPLDVITLNYETYIPSTDLIQQDWIFVTSFNQVPGADFQVFYNEQVASFIVPQAQTALDITGSPVAGLTNQQNWDQYQIAIAGAVAPASATTMDGISDLVAPITSALPPAPPATPAAQPDPPGVAGPGGSTTGTGTGSGTGSGAGTGSGTGGTGTVTGPGVAPTSSSGGGHCGLGGSMGLVGFGLLLWQRRRSQRPRVVGPVER